MLKYCRHKFILVILGAGLVLVLSWWAWGKQDWGEKDKKDIQIEDNTPSNIDDNVENSRVVVTEGTETKDKTDKKQNNKEKNLPDKIQLTVPFVSQAPFAVWDELHEEACEEASLITVYFYLKGKNLTKEKMEREIQDLVKYQKKEYGDYKDSNMQELKKIAEDYYKIENIEILKDFNIKDLKIKLAEGHLIIVPAAGRELGNPNFTSPGPLYHNLVIVGYDNLDSAFITNDPGTRRGEGYKYDYQILYDAIHDFPGKKSEILKGEKRALVF